MEITEYEPITLTIDGEDFVLGLKRLNFKEGTWFRENYRRLNNPINERHITRKPDERAKNEMGEFEISEAEIQVRRIGEMSPEKRKDFEREVDADLDFRVRFVTQTFEKFVRVESGLTENGEPVTDGAAFLNAFGSRWEVPVKVMSVIWARCVLGQREKKVSQLVIDSFDFLAASAKARAGTRRATTAANAERSDSAKPAGAGSPSTDPSGSTDPTSSTPVRSLR